MRKIACFLFLIVAPILFSVAAFAQIGAITDYCNLGAAQAKTSGLQSSNYLQGVIPSCTVTVYLTGTTTLATIYADSSSTPLTNPFTATTAGQWLFFAAIGQGYDVVLSGGVSPNIYHSSVTLTGLYPSSGIVQWGGIVGTLSNQTDLQTALNAKLSLTGGTMTGILTMGSTLILGVSSYAQLLSAISTCGSSQCALYITGVVAPTANLSIPANVQLYFQGGSFKPSSGVTISVATTSVYGSGFIFNESSGGVITFTSAIDIPVEWFGAVGDGVFSTATGTDNTTAIQETINSLTYGHAVLGCHNYLVSSALTVSQSYVGVRGVESCTGQTPTVFSTSASANILVLHSSSILTQRNDFRNFTLERTAVPTGTAAGFYSNGAQYITVDHVNSWDSISDFWIHATQLSTFSNDWGGHGQITSGYTTALTVYAFNFDTEDGTNDTSTIASYCTAQALSAVWSILNTYGFYLHGQEIRAITIDHPFDFQNTTALIIVADNAGVDVDQYAAVNISDVFFDGIRQTAIYISGLTGSLTWPSLNISRGWVDSESSSGYVAIYATSSSGISFDNLKIKNPTGPAIQMVSSSQMRVLNNYIFLTVGVGISLNGVTSSTVVGNNISGTSSYPFTDGIDVLNVSKNNIVVGNTISGYGTNGINVDLVSSESNNITWPNIIQSETLSGAQYAGAANPNITVPGTSNSSYAFNVVQSGLSTGNQTGFTAGTALASSYNSALFNFLNTGGSGSATNQACMSVWGGGTFCTSGNSNATQNVGGTSTQVNGIGILESSLGTGNEVGFSAGTVQNSAYNTALFGLIYSGGNGSTTNKAYMGVYGGPILNIDGLGNVQVNGVAVPTETGTTPTVGAGVCWKTTTTLGTCTAGTWPSCSTCN